MPETKTTAQKLRAPFDAALIGVLPKPYSKDSPKGKCPECGGYHGMPAVHLDYVGHAAVTDRLLQVDPGWSWEPFATDDVGLPALTRGGDLWIRLTIDGVTRIGVGDGSSMKERIGDAIRNAAMRFGVALDLWSKEDLAGFSAAQDEQRARDEQQQREAAMTPEERAEAAVQAAQAARERRNGGRRADERTNARGRAWDAVSEYDLLSNGVQGTQPYRQQIITAELERREWPDPQSLSVDYWTELAVYYEEKADDAIRQQHIERGVDA